MPLIVVGAIPLQMQMSVIREASESVGERSDQYRPQKQQTTTKASRSR